MESAVLAEKAMYANIKRYVTTDDTKDTMSHVLLNGALGGKLSVPLDKMSEFYNCLGKALDNHAKIPICEVIHEPYFRYFADIDLVADRGITQEELLQILSVVQAGVKKFFAVTNAAVPWFNMVCLTPDPPPFETVELALKARDREVEMKRHAGIDNLRIKSGIHLVMPNLIVTASQCLTIRMTILEMLQEELFDTGATFGLTDCNLVEDMFDRNVYIAPVGLRMPGAVKYDICSSCRNNAKTKRNCPSCVGAGKRCIDRAYKARGIFKQGGALSSLAPGMHVELQYGTLRYISSKKRVLNVDDLYNLQDGITYIEPRDCPKDIAAAGRSSSSSITKHQKTLGGILTAPPPQLSGDAAAKRRKKNMVPVTSEVIKHHAHEAVKHAMMIMFNVDYSQVNSTKLHSINVSETSRVFNHSLAGGKYPDRTYFIVTTGPFQRQCANLKKESPYNQMHTSSSTYWVIQKLAISQRCFCSKLTSPKFLHPDVPCSKYVSQGIVLSKPIALALYKDLGEIPGATGAAAAAAIDDRDLGDQYSRALRDMPPRMRAHFDDKLPGSVQKCTEEDLLYGVPKKELAKQQSAIVLHGLERIKMYMTTAAIEYDKAKSAMNQSPAMNAGRKRKRNSFV